MAASLALAPNSVSAKAVPMQAAESLKTPLTKENEALQREIFEKYGIQIVHGFTPSLKLYGYFGRSTDPEHVREVLKLLVQELAKYPHTMVTRHLPKRFYFVEGLEENGHTFEGFHNRVEGFIMVSLAQNDKAFDPRDGVSYVFHENFHFAEDIPDKDKIKRDDQLWAAANSHGMHDYTYASGSEAAKNEKKLDWKTPQPGFASPYGKHGGVREDQATMGEDLLNSAGIQNLFERAVTDQPLRKKIEMATACIFDLRKKCFIRMMSRQEYKEKYGFDGYRYYAKWSENERGEVEMDQHFWNTIAGCTTVYNPNRYGVRRLEEPREKEEVTSPKSSLSDRALIAAAVGSVMAVSGAIAWRRRRSGSRSR